MDFNPGRRRPHRRRAPSGFLLAALAIHGLLLIALAGPSYAGSITILDDAGRVVHLRPPPTASFPYLPR